MLNVYFFKENLLTTYKKKSKVKQDRIIYLKKINKYYSVYQPMKNQLTIVLFFFNFYYILYDILEVETLKHFNPKFKK